MTRVSGPDIRRHPDGGIDFNYYRTMATAMRGNAMREASTLRLASAGGLVMAGTLGFAMVISSIPTRTLGDLMAAASFNASRLR